MRTRLVIGLSVVTILGWSVHRLVARPMRYEFPERFKGWLVVRYEDPNCPPLLRRGIFLVVSVPVSGQVCTSSRRPEGWIYYRFDYLEPGGNRTSVPLRTGSDPPGIVQVWLVTYLPDYKWEEDWVGTKEEANHWGTPPDPWRQRPIPMSVRDCERD
jgi:hypothetical protein